METSTNLAKTQILRTIYGQHYSYYQLQAPEQIQLVCWLLPLENMYKSVCSFIAWGNQGMNWLTGPQTGRFWSHPWNRGLATLFLTPEPRTCRVWSHPRNRRLTAFGLTPETVDWPHLVSPLERRTGRIWSPRLLLTTFGLSLPWGITQKVKKYLYNAKVTSEH